MTAVDFDVYWGYRSTSPRGIRDPLGGGAADRPSHGGANQEPPLLQGPALRATC